MGASPTVVELGHTASYAASRMPPLYFSIKLSRPHNSRNVKRLCVQSSVNAVQQCTIGSPPAAVRDFLLNNTWLAVLDRLKGVISVYLPPEER
ncbi:Hypothetical protein CpCap5W_0428 [Corynebacterium pseudotuberculosis]|nr:Hypothetical protein CpATCC19410_0441 [Corynebacterium pseudotuberculosis]AZN19298.1 hypothetical protein CpCap1W_0428 [Corynebacterium pseudotuberculosis]AZN21399.1 Hypothetical protein CpOviAF1_0426 [Corynebacterium pseudotuberculosis]QBB92536.1 hypothetical protein CpCAPNAT1_00425 [Corynebacterium pseudotuberculosis]QBB98875.1 hypothetical protein Cp87MAT_0432 [Corynebacterium pseudotuberculosis]